MRHSVLVIGLLLTIAGSATGTTYVVRPDGTGDFPTIQAAIDACFDGDIIELTDGMFTGDGNRDLDFLGKAITLRSETDDPEACILDCEGTPKAPHRAICFHMGEGGSTVVRGLTITGGATAPAPAPGRVGGGVRCLKASGPTIENCRFVDNKAGVSGGALCCDDASCPTLIGCRFINNDSKYGGAVRLVNGSSAYLEDCHFTGNTASDHGGGLDCTASNPILTGCVFSGNTAVSVGGAVYCWSGTEANLTDCTFLENDCYLGGAVGCEIGVTVTLERCTFVRNTANLGGGVFCWIGTATLTNCTIVGNSGPHGGGVCCWPESEVRLENTIIAHSAVGPAIDCYSDGHAILSCCDIFGNAGGDWVGCIAGQYGINGNICEDPLFCDPQNGDFTLQCDSPCAPFTQPNPECDLIGAWPVGCGNPADIGAHEPQPTALMLYRPVPNPVVHSTLIRYELPELTQAELAVHDATGRIVRTLIGATQVPGRHAVHWDGMAQDGRQAPAGVYFYRLTVGEQTATKRLLLVR